MKTAHTSLLVRRLEPWVKDRLHHQAKAHGRSLEAEVRAILLAAATEQKPAMDWSGFKTVSSGRTGPVTRDEVNAAYDDA
ncbi:hypothetical protein LBMAG53_21150 [Planctomycetota bacterium]|nr:hypothetical protein LBMAG53_21150 [Planctomycetota bacterium]